MEMGSKFKWATIMIILLFVLIFVGWGLSAIARSVFSKKNDTNSTQQLVAEDTISNLQGVGVVRYIVDGPIVSSSEHRSYTIEVTSAKVSMKVFSDYGQKVVSEKSYTNNTGSYDNFIQSLEKANALARFEGTDSEDDNSDKGACPSGKRYIFEAGSEERRWTTSCDRSLGTAAGKMTTLRELFRKQIPDYSTLIKDTGL